MWARLAPRVMIIPFIKYDNNASHCNYYLLPGFIKVTLWHLAHVGSVLAACKAV